eukprot:31545-Pelagococcus_subviridis.AAC.9
MTFTVWFVYERIKTFSGLRSAWMMSKPWRNSSEVNICRAIDRSVLSVKYGSVRTEELRDDEQMLAMVEVIVHPQDPFRVFRVRVVHHGQQLDLVQRLIEVVLVVLDDLHAHALAGDEIARSQRGGKRRGAEMVRELVPTRDDHAHSRGELFRGLEPGAVQTVHDPKVEFGEVAAIVVVVEVVVVEVVVAREVIVLVFVVVFRALLPSRPRRLRARAARRFLFLFLRRRLFVFHVGRDRILRVVLLVRRRRRRRGTFRVRPASLPLPLPLPGRVRIRVRVAIGPIPRRGPRPERVRGVVQARRRAARVAPDAADGGGPRGAVPFGRPPELAPAPPQRDLSVPARRAAAAGVGVAAGRRASTGATATATRTRTRTATATATVRRAVR